MEIKPGEHYIETSTERRFVVTNLTEHTNNTWVAFQNLETRTNFTVSLAQFERDFVPA
jgi:hypothetical protein